MAQMEARRDNEQTHMKTFMHRDAVRKKSVNSFVNRLQKRTAAPDAGMLMVLTVSQW